MFANIPNAHNNDNNKSRIKEENQTINVFKIPQMSIESLDEPLRPISQLTLSLLRLLDSNFPGTPLWALEFHPLKLRLRLSQAP